MAAMRYLPNAEPEKPALNDEEVKVMDRVLYAWSIWAWRTSSDLGYPQAGNIWGLKKPGSDLKELDLSDDQLVLVDRAIARLPWRTGRKMIFVEYFQTEPIEVKAKRFNLSRRSYRRRLDELRQDLYRDCLPDIERWDLLVRDGS